MYVINLTNQKKYLNWKKFVILKKVNMSWFGSTHTAPRIFWTFPYKYSLRNEHLFMFKGREQYNCNSSKFPFLTNTNFFIDYLESKMILFIKNLLKNYFWKLRNFCNEKMKNHQFNFNQSKFTLIRDFKLFLSVFRIKNHISSWKIEKN